MLLISFSYNNLAFGGNIIVTNYTFYYKYYVLRSTQRELANFCQIVFEYIFIPQKLLPVDADSKASNWPIRSCDYWHI